MNGILAIGAGAGLASGLLFSAVITGKAIAILLYFVAPLPILLAALGWNHRAGLAACLAGALFVGAIFTPLSGVAYAATVAVPAWWYGYLLLLGRADGDRMEWYPLGRLLVWIAGIQTALTVVAAMMLGADYDAFVAAFARAVQFIESINPQGLEGLSSESHAKSALELAQLLALVAPPISAAVGVVTAVMLIWIAAKITAFSKRFPRPWPDLTMTVLPRIAFALLVLGVVGTLLLGGFPGVGARSLAASMTMAFALQGLAVIHVLTLGMAGRTGILAATYAILIILPVWPALLYAVLGLVDGALGLRARKRPGSAPHLPSA